MIQRPLLGAFLLIALLAASCAAPPDGKQKTPEGPQFDADYYAKNAKEYYGGGRYSQAKDQWQKQLTKDPDNWMARLGIAYSDYYLAQPYVTRGDLVSARKQAGAAEKGFRDVWGGNIEADTATADPKRPQWRAAIGLAMAQRMLGVLDQMESLRAEEVVRRGGPDAAKAAQRVGELQVDRDRHYQDAIALFVQLANMQHASPDAIKNLGELYIVTKQDALAEQEFKRYLDMASRTHAEFEEKKKEAEKTYGRGGLEVAEQLFEEKLTSNAQKQVSVRVDLAQLAWTRGDYNEARQQLETSIALQPDRKDLYLKLAEAENKLDMLETGVTHVDEFLRRSSAGGAEFDDDIRVAMKLRQEMEQKLRSRGGK
jgi:Tfp pilus assembly protein PilF